jgi:hypothetical protein
MPNCIFDMRNVSNECVKWHENGSSRVTADLQKLHYLQYLTEFGDEVPRFCFALSRR